MKPKRTEVDAGTLLARAYIAVILFVVGAIEFNPIGNRAMLRHFEQSPPRLFALEAQPFSSKAAELAWMAQMNVREKTFVHGAIAYEIVQFYQRPAVRVQKGYVYAPDFFPHENVRLVERLRYGLDWLGNLVLPDMFQHVEGDWYLYQIYLEY